MKRKERKLNKAKKARKAFVGINLVSLMDIFTILVFFLLVNSTDVAVLQSDQSVKLPESISDKFPSETLIIMVNENHVVVQGRDIVAVQDILKTKGTTIKLLREELKYQAERLQPGVSEQEKVIGAVTIMGDKEIPYKILKKIMVTCAESNFGNISLAVQQKSVKEG